MTEAEAGAEAGQGADPGQDKAAGRGARSRRWMWVTAGALALVCAGIAGLAVHEPSGGGGSGERRPARAVPTAEVTYVVTGRGTAEITYRPEGGTDATTVVREAALPWRKSIRLPVGKSPTVAVVLGGSGGRAACTVAVRGEHVQRATATGSYGRATCGGERLE
ncbi:hypothetical protein OG711_04335 [Streptomyces uncialis]|uniref:hypothetical protein n=1 Tax=Streptomyces uncialis TaxID=1048205 RepID=UPI002E35C402|nr:hypothetical protein [Streptomyces uncialis]